MAELAASGPFGSDQPYTIGSVTLAALPWGPRASVAPYAGREAEVAVVLGADLPPPGRSAALAAGRIHWAGVGLWLVDAPMPSLAGLDGLAAVTDQSDGWAALAIAGSAAQDVLARLVPVDLDPAAFGSGRVARTLLGHLACIFIANDGGFEVLVPRSTARTAVEDIVRAMRAVAARDALGDG